MAHDNLSVAILTPDTELAAKLTAHLEADGWLPGALDTVDELRGYLEDKYLDVVLLDEPDDELWAMCVAVQNASESQSPVLAVIAPADDVQEFRDAGGDIVLPKPASVEDIGGGLRSFFG